MVSACQLCLKNLNNDRMNDRMYIMIPVDNKEVLDINFSVNMILTAQNQTDEAYGNKRPPSSGTAADVLSEAVLVREVQRQAEEECVLPRWHCCYYCSP